MKIKHKVSGLTLEGRFTYDGTDYRDTGAHGYSLYHNSQWEEVAEWKDVTHECTWEEHPCGVYDERWRDEWYISHKGSRVEAHPHRYRVRAVKLYDGYCSTSIQAAFIVEKRND